MTLKMVVWDVQHGSAIYIKTPNGTHIVQDLGTGSYGGESVDFSPLLNLKDEWGVEQIDWVIITHPHKDHIADIMNFDKLSPRVLSRPKHLSEHQITENLREEDTGLFKKYFEINKRYSNAVKPEEDPRLPDNNGGVEIETFTPKLSSSSNINDSSMVTILSHADSKLVLPGDNEPSSWTELLKAEEFREAIRGADILLAPHHGRESGFYPELFESFKPKLTIISDGRFCDASATNRYSKVSSGWEVHRRDGQNETRYCVTTRNDGPIVVELGYRTDGKPFMQVTVD